MRMQTSLNWGVAVWIGVLLSGSRSVWGTPPPPPPPPPPPECTTNWCELVQGPAGTITYAEAEVWPGPEVCNRSWVYTGVGTDYTCNDVIARMRSAPESTNCPPVYWTNLCQLPYFETNWWVLTFPGQSDAGEGTNMWFMPTNCGQGSVTFYGVWKNVDPCTGQLVGGGTTSNSVSFTVKSGLLEIILEGSGTGPLYAPDWVPKLGNVLGALTGSPFNISDPPEFQTTTFTNYSLFCCDCSIGGSGMVNLDYWHANIANTGFGVTWNLSLLNTLPSWLNTAADLIQAAFPEEAGLFDIVTNWFIASGGFNASGNADWKGVTFSDSCWGCMQNPEISLGTSAANLNGSIYVHIAPLGIYVNALIGYVNTTTQAWAQYMGPLQTDSDWYVQAHRTYHLYSSAVIGDWILTPIEWLQQGGSYDPHPAISVPVCLGPNFVVPSLQ